MAARPFHNIRNWSKTGEDKPSPLPYSVAPGGFDGYIIYLEERQQFMDVKQITEIVEQVSQLYAEKFNKEMDAKWLSRRKELRLSWPKDASPASSSESTNAANSHTANEEALEEQEERDER
jgi:hypothetical protein